MHARTSTTPVFAAISALALLSAAALGAARSVDQPWVEASVSSEKARRTISDIDGRLIDLDALRGKVVVLDFWATWCGPCARSLALVDREVRAAGDGVVFFAINTDDRETVQQIREFLRARKLDIRAAPRGKEFSRGFDVGPIPHLVILGKQGELVSKHVGITNEAAFSKSVRDDIRRALK